MTELFDRIPDRHMTDCRPTNATNCRTDGEKWPVNDNKRTDKNVHTYDTLSVISKHYFIQ